MTFNHYLIIGGVAFVLLIAIITKYNSIIKQKNNVLETKSTIDTVLKNRFDLIPNLISMVKQYMKHEASVLEKVTQQRANIMNGQGGTSEQYAAENDISHAFKSIFAVAESYPDLKANSNFLQVQGQLSELEDRLQAARRVYNAAVKELMNTRETFPSNIIAGMMTLPNAPMFTASTQERQNVNVQAMFDS